MSAPGSNFNPLGVDLFGDPIQPPGQSKLAERFGVPPFSVLNAREGDWAERKRNWLALGIRSELGRTHLKSTSAAGWVNRGGDEGGSVFDPVLCELYYRWFCPAGGLILDPFAGGSVRGVVAAMLGYRYVGIELRKEQVDANYEQAKGICNDALVDDRLVWLNGDSAQVLRQDFVPKADMVFTCPPYGDLEVYSDDPRDISTMDYPTFLKVYSDIMQAAAAKMVPNSFMHYVVGDYRDKKSGNYRGFVADTINAGRAAGLGLYNEAIVVSPVGSLCIRVTNQFNAGRKLGKTHQNIVTFAKGDGKAAGVRCRAADEPVVEAEVEGGDEDEHPL